MRRLFVCMIIIGLIFALYIETAFTACPFCKTSEESVLVLDIIPEGDFSEQNMKYFQDGLKQLNEEESKMYPERYQEVKVLTGIPHYYQSGEDWSDDIMQTCGETIGYSGCLVTSFAMVTNYYGSSDDPGEVNSTIGTNACPFKWKPAGSLYGLALPGFKEGEPISEDYAKTYIKGAIRNDEPVIVGFKRGEDTHFVVARAFYIFDDGREWYFIYDPSRGRDYMYLDDYLDNGWYIYRLAVYTD